MKLKTADELGVSAKPVGREIQQSQGGGCLMAFGAIFVCSGLAAIGGTIATGEGEAMLIGGAVGGIHFLVGCGIVYAGYYQWTQKGKK